MSPKQPIPSVAQWYAAKVDADGRAWLPRHQQQQHHWLVKFVNPTGTTVRYAHCCAESVELELYPAETSLAILYERLRILQHLRRPRPGIRRRRCSLEVRRAEARALDTTRDASVDYAPDETVRRRPDNNETSDCDF
jgi:hypothetical protein